MKWILKRMKINNVILLLILLLICCISVSAEESAINTGMGKPKALDIYIGEFPYSASIGGNVTSTSKEEVPNEFKVVIDDKKIEEPTWFPVLGEGGTPTEPTPGETPTIEPTPTVTVAIPVDLTTKGASLCVKDNTSRIIVDFAYSSAGYKNVFALSSPSQVPLGESQGEMPDNRIGTDLGTTWDLGRFSIGQELIFTDTANGKTYYTGPASRNPDKVVHAAVSLKNSTGTYHKYLVSFEDFWKGGDLDYNDLEFYVSGNLSTDCSISGSSAEGEGESGSGSVIPNFVNVCKCTNGKVNKKDVCIAFFTYNSSVNNLEIPVRGKSLPWNEFSGSGMVKQFRCQPTTFYVDSSPNKVAQKLPFHTNRFWDNIMWKLGYEKSILVKCDKSTPTCESLGYNSNDYCQDC